MLEKFAKRNRRAIRVRARIEGTATKPRLSVFRSNLHISVQLIDDLSGKTLCSANDIDAKGTKSERATLVGQEIAKKALELGVKECVFDRGGCLFHGRVKALADAAREAGLAL